MNTLVIEFDANVADLIKTVFYRGNPLHQFLRGLKNTIPDFRQEEQQQCYVDTRLVEIQKLKAKIAEMQAEYKALEKRRNAYPETYTYIKGRVQKEMNMLRGHILTEQKKLKKLVSESV